MCRPILSNCAKISAGRPLLPAYNFRPLIYTTYRLEALASLKFLAIETMPPLFSAHVYYGKTAGSRIHDTTWYRGTPRPRQNCVRWGSAPPHPPKGAQQSLPFSAHCSICCIPACRPAFYS